MNRVSISCSTRLYEKLARNLQKVLSQALRQLEQKNVELSVRLTTNKEIQTLNHIYRKKDRPTDVLSFSQTDKPMLGDIVISVPTARKQAQTAKQTLMQECTMLAIHGLLHLLGHDHEQQNQAKKMFALQDQILKKVGSRA